MYTQRMYKHNVRFNMANIIEYIQIYIFIFIYINIYAAKMRKKNNFRQQRFERKQVYTNLLFFYLSFNVLKEFLDLEMNIILNSDYFLTNFWSFKLSLVFQKVDDF